MDEEGEGEREIGVDFEVLLLEASLRFLAWKCGVVWAAINQVRKCKRRIKTLGIENRGLLGSRGISEVESSGSWHAWIQLVFVESLVL